MLTTVRLSFTFQQTDLQTFSVIEKKVLFSLHCHLRFLLIHYFSSEKSECEEAWKYVEFLKMDVTEPVNTILQVGQGTIKKSKFCLINKKLFQETLYDAKLKPSEEGLEETLEVSMKQVIMMMMVGTLNIDAGIIYFTIMKSYCTL